MARRNNNQAAQRERERQQRQRERERQQRQREQQQRERQRQQQEAQRRAQQEAQRRAQQQAQRRAQQQAQQRKAQQEAQRRAQQQKAKQEAQRKAQQQKAKNNNNKNKNQGGNVKQVIRQAGPVISNKEMKQIVKAAGGDTKKAINRIASVQSNFKDQGKQAPTVGSGAANMLIKQAEKTPLFQRDGFGDSKLGQTLQSMVPIQEISGYAKGQKRTIIEGSPGFNPGGSPTKNRMIGGTVIRPGGTIANRPMSIAAAPAAPAPTPTPDGGGGDGGTGGGGEGLSFDDLLAQLGEMFAPPEPMMPMMPEMPTFENISSDFETRDPLQLAALGQAYGGDMIRARQRQRKTRSDYRRGMLGQLGITGANNFTPLMIGGGLTL